MLYIFFRCLIKDRTLHYKPEKATAIINSCVVLHNMCITFNVPEYLENTDDYDFGMYHDQNNMEANVLNDRNRELILGRHQRQRICRLLQNRNIRE